MNRKFCLVAVANDFLHTLVNRLPQGVFVTGQQEDFGKAVTILRLGGPALPDWCQEPPHGGPFAWGAAIIGGDGVLRIVPAGGQQQAERPGGWFNFERILEEYGRFN